MNRITEKLENGFYELKPENEFYGWENGIRLVQIVGNYEDIFELIDEMYKKPVCWKDDYGEIFYEYYTHSTILYNPRTNEIEIYEYEFIARYKVEEYGITWWLKDKSERYV